MFESYSPMVDPAETERALAYYREAFADDDVTKGTVLELKEGEGGYCIYWSVQLDSLGRYWLGPLSRLDSEPFDSSIFIRFHQGGFVADFRRVMGGRDRFYDQVIPAEYVISLEPDRFYGIPIVDVIGDADQLPGYFCDEDGQPPHPGPNGEDYVAADTSSYAAAAAIYEQYGVPIPVELKQLYGINE